MTVFSLLSLLLILRLRPALLEHLAVHGDRGQWRFELVADRGNEVLLMNAQRRCAVGFERYCPREATIIRPAEDAGGQTVRSLRDPGAQKLHHDSLLYC